MSTQGASIVTNTGKTLANEQAIQSLDGRVTTLENAP